MPKANGTWGRRDEPTWHDPQTLLRVGHAERFSHLSDIQAAFSAGYRFYVHLPVFRNYFAHRNKDTKYAAASIGPQYGISATKRPSQILLTRPLNRPQPLILEWMDEMQFTIEYLCH